MHEELIKRRSWFLDMEKAIADSSKRIGQSKTSDTSILGVEGNFKTLSFDWTPPSEDNRGGSGAGLKSIPVLVM